jgi:hypothetical protein
MNTVNQASDNRDESTPAYRINEAVLRAEIGFWQELIDTREESMADDSLERMHQALALAQCKLTSLFKNHPQSTNGNHHNLSNVYCISQRRN